MSGQAERNDDSDSANAVQCVVRYVHIVECET